MTPKVKAGEALEGSDVFSLPQAARSKEREIRRATKIQIFFRAVMPSPPEVILTWFKVRAVYYKDRGGVKGFEWGFDRR